MELRDLIVTPLLIIMVYAFAYFIRPYVTDAVNYRYFIPGLTVRIVGALMVGFVYQFYYQGGDTFAYHTHGSRHIWELIMQSPADGFQVLRSNGQYGPGLWEIADKIWYWRDPSSFFVIKVATIFDLFTFSSYSGTATLFAVLAFAGGWMLFLTFYDLYPDFHRWIALSTLFVPSVIFWGSGIFKDCLTLAALGISTYCFYQIFIKRRFSIVKLVLLLFCLRLIYSIKIYILLCFLPSMLVWWVAKRIMTIEPKFIRLILIPFVFTTVLVFCYYAIATVGGESERYSLSRISETAKITAYDIRYGWGARTGEGSGYTLGELDGSWQSMVALSFPAINVSLFRPYLWEVRNPLMMLSAIEAFVCLMVTLYIIIKVRSSIFRYLIKPDVLFCIFFALIFAFAVGVSTYNFGSLSRYKIPLMPFYLLGLSLIYNYWKSERNLDALDSTE